MLKRVLCLAVILFSSLFSQELDYMVFGKDIDKTMLINAQKNLYEQTFSDSLISWNKDGLYVFADYNGIKKLFVFEKNNVVRVFSIPVIRQSSLLDPEKYSDEVKKLSTRKLDSRCYTEIELDSNKEHSLMQTRFWKLPYVVPYREYSFLPLRIKILVIYSIIICPKFELDISEKYLLISFKFPKSFLSFKTSNCRFTRRVK